MAPERGRQLLLGLVVVVLATAVYRVWTATSTTSTTGAAASNQRSGSASGLARASTTPGTPSAPDVHLQALSGKKPKPGSGERNLFRFKPKAPPPSARVTPPPDPGVPMAPTGPPPPPPLPPIPMKFIGIVVRGSADGGSPVTRVAVLSDTTGHVTYGVEGGTIDGRYRIERIGEQSIELSYLDGRGRQTIRLTGS